MPGPFPIIKSRQHKNTNPLAAVMPYVSQMAMMQNLGEKSKVESETKLVQQQGKTSLEAGQDLNKILNLSDNLISSIKSANLQQGGGGPIRGRIGNLASNIGLENTGNIKALKNVKRDTALAFTRVLAGGARGVATLFSNVLDSIPDNKYTSEQSGSTMAELMQTAYGFKKGVDESGLNQQQLNDLTPEQAAQILSKGRGLITPEETKSIYDGLSEKFKNIQPRQQINLEGNVSSPSINPLSKFIYGNSGNDKAKQIVNKYKGKYGSI